MVLSSLIWLIYLAGKLQAHVPNTVLLFYFQIVPCLSRLFFQAHLFYKSAVSAHWILTLGVTYTHGYPSDQQN